jgi:hypothetical protein
MSNTKKDKIMKTKMEYNRSFIIRNEISKPLLEQVNGSDEDAQWLFESGESFHGEHDGKHFHFKDSRISRYLKLPLSCVTLEFSEEDLKKDKI